MPMTVSLALASDAFMGTWSIQVISVAYTLCPLIQNTSKRAVLASRKLPVLCTRTSQPQCCYPLARYPRHPKLPQSKLSVHRSSATGGIHASACPTSGRTAYRMGYYPQAQAIGPSPVVFLPTPIATTVNPGSRSVPTGAKHSLHPDWPDAIGNQSP